MKKFNLLALLLVSMLSINLWATDYTLVATFDCAAASNNSNGQTDYGVNSSTKMQANGIKTFLNKAVSSTIVNSVSDVSGSTYWQKGQGGTGIPDYCLKIGTASGAGSFSFTLNDTFDKIDKVEVVGYGWKNTSKIAVNGSSTQSPSAAATETTFPFELSSATRTITISVTTSAVCVTAIKLYKTAAPAADSYNVQYTLNGGTHGTNHPTSAEIGTAFAVSAPTKAYYTFDGWTVTSGLNASTAKWGTNDNPSSSITSSSTKCVNGTSDVYFKNLGSKDANVTLTANWTENAKVNVYFSDAIHDHNSNYQAYVGSKISFPTINDAPPVAPTGDCVTDHYHFVGWTKDVANPNALVIPANEMAPSTDITYFAVWAKEAE